MTKKQEKSTISHLSPLTSHLSPLTSHLNGATPCVSVVVAVTIIGDYTSEEEEYYYLQISDPQGENFDTGVTEIKTKRTIIDDD